MDAPVEVLLFDLGGVVIDIDIGRTFARLAAHGGRDPAHVTSRAAFDEAYRRYERGQVGTADYFAYLGRQLELELSDEQWLDGWNAVFVGDMPGIEAVLEQARRRMPIYAFSNTNPVHEAEVFRRFAHLTGYFDRVFMSPTIQLRKPDREAFDYVVQAIGQPAGRILFFDDLAENVEGARAAGLQAVQVTSPATVGDALARLWPD